MSLLSHRHLPLLLLLFSAATSAIAEEKRDSSRHEIEVSPVSLPAKFCNEPWPKEWEENFWRRARYVIEETASEGRYGTTWFESEKRSYGWAMLSILGGYEKAGVDFLQSEDPAAEQWNKHTLGIDYFPAFTLKQQMRKYFYFGHLLDDDYRQRMKKAADIFTEKDPLRRPHYAYTGKEGWDPGAKNSWVDVRSTDNLKLMRETSVYLLAEQTGNDQTRQLYKERLKEFIVALYYVGQGEWDSENYLGHGIAPLLNLYDFARDEEVKLLAKAGLDFMATSAAIKYWRGAYNGPTRRDYNHPYPFGGSAAFQAWLWFGDAPQRPEEFEPDAVHAITSAYRPPAAVVHLAHKNFDRPQEIIAGKPQWAAWEHLDDPQPTYRETQYFGKTFQFGTLVRGTQEPDINGFKLLTYSSKRGADTITAAPCRDPLKLGSPMYRSGLLAQDSTVGQNGNMAVYLTRQSDHPYLWLIPDYAEVKEKNGVTFIFCEKNTIAIWPLNISPPKVDGDLTRQVQNTEKSGKTEERHGWSNCKILKATRRGAGVYGFAIEIDEGSPDKFVEAASKIRGETDELHPRGAASITAAGGRRLRVQWGDNPGGIKIWRNGQLKDFNSDEENVLWRTLDGDLIHHEWQGDGTLSVTAGGESFRCTVTRDGEVSFTEE